jgi:hypothetical protein
MTYATSNPPRVVGDSIGGGCTLWLYSSTDDDATTNGSGYYSNGVALGMKVGDVVLVSDTTTPKSSLHFVTSVNTTTGTATTGFGAVS